MKERIKVDDDNTGESATGGGARSSSSQKDAREKARRERMHGKLTDLVFSDITVTRKGKADFIKPGLLMVVRGSKSQFDARKGRMKAVLPPLTCDCCQTFSTLSAVLLSSLGFAVMLSECCSTSTVNYILYIAAWMHQLSSTCWPQGGIRPTLRDLNTCLRLHDFFPAKVRDDEFEIVFYNQADKARDLICQMCTTKKRERESSGKLPVCGYVIVSGDYTVSIFSVNHDIEDADSSRYSHAWSLYICDSHGTQPWSMGKASITGLTLGHPRDVGGASPPNNDGQDVTTTADGIHYFSTILFTLLEEHRKSGPRGSQVPYMTWTPLRRRRCLAYTATELKDIIDNHWVPKVMCSENIQREAEKFNFKPINCFWGTPQINGGKCDEAH